MSRYFSICVAFIWLAALLPSGAQTFETGPGNIRHEYIYGAENFAKCFDEYNKELLQTASKRVIEAISSGQLSGSADRGALLEAEIDIVAGNHRAAEGQLKQFIDARRNSPLVPHAYLLRGLNAFTAKDYQEAARLFAQAESSAKDNFSCEKCNMARNDSTYLDLAHRAIYWSGVANANMSKQKPATADFEKCYRLYPTFEYADDALFALGLLAEMGRNFEVAENYYNTVLKKYPFSNTAIISRIREINNRLVLRETAQAVASVATLEMAWGHIVARDSIGKMYETQSYTDKANEEILYLKAETNCQTERFPYAIDNYQELIRRYPESNLCGPSRLGIGWALLNSGKYLQAIDYYDTIINSETGAAPSRVKETAQLYKGIALKKSGKTEAAQALFSELSVQSTYPYLGQVLLELGQIYYESGDYTNAQRVLERAEREATDGSATVRINILLGSAYMEQRKWDKAILKYRTAEQISTKSSAVFMPQRDMYIAEAKLKAGISLVESNRHAEAIPALLGFIGLRRDDPRQDEAMFWLAEAYYRSDMCKNAIETFQSILERTPDTKRKEEILYGQGWAYFRLKDFKNSSAAFDRMIKEFPNSQYAVEVLSRQGDGYYVEKDFRRASESYRRAASMAETSEEGQYSMYQLCNSLYRLGSLDEAGNSLRAFLSKYPKSPYAPYTMYLSGWIKFQQKRYAESIDIFKSLAQTYPASELKVRADYATSDAYYNLGNYEVALASYKRIIENYPNNALAPEALKGVQYCLVALGREEEALQIVETYTETNPTSPFAPEFMKKKIEFLYQAKRFKDAASEYENFIQKYPENDKNDEALFWMGKSYANMNEVDKAVDAFHRLQKRYPKSSFAPDSWLELGLLYKQVGRIDMADSSFSKLRQQYPTDLITAQANFELASIKYGIGDTAAAVDIFRETAIKFSNTEFADTSLYHLAMYYRFKGMNDSARMAFTVLASKIQNPKLSAEAQYRIGELWLSEGDFAAAEQAFLSVRERFSGIEDWFSLALLSLGECYEHLQRADQAEEVYKYIMSLRPDDDFGKTAKYRLKELKK